MQTGVQISTIPFWLDAPSAALVVDIVRSLQQYPDILAIILYGSLARHDERKDSDIDLLAVFDIDQDPVSIDYPKDYIALLVDVEYRHYPAARELQIMRVSRDLHECDATYIEHMAQDGILLYGTWPQALQHVRMNRVENNRTCRSDNSAIST